jgi:hypothetical protein
MFILFDSQSIDSCEANLKKKPIRQPKSVFLFLIPVHFLFSIAALDKPTKKIQ